MENIIKNNVEIFVNIKAARKMLDVAGFHDAARNMTDEEIFEKALSRACIYGVSFEIKPISENEEKLIDYIMANMHWCPFKDDCGIDFEKDCVGFGEIGCKECIHRNIDKIPKQE